jgi:hypothetical protein
MINSTLQTNKPGIERLEIWPEVSDWGGLELRTQQVSTKPNQTLRSSVVVSEEFEPQEGLTGLDDFYAFMVLINPRAQGTENQIHKEAKS